MRGDTSVAVIALRSTPVLMTGWKAEASATHTSRTRVRSMVKVGRMGNVARLERRRNSRV